MMYQTSDNSQLREEYCESMHSWLLSEVWNIIAPNLSIFSTFWITKWSKEGTWFHSFEKSHSLNFCLKVTFTTHLGIELMIACCSKKIKYVAIFLVHLLHSKQEILWRLLSLTLMFQKQRVQPNLTLWTNSDFKGAHSYTSVRFGQHSKLYHQMNFSA